MIKGYNFQSQISDQYPRREDLVRIDYNLTSKARVFGHFINNNNTYQSHYGSFVLGFEHAALADSVCEPGHQLGSRQHLHLRPDADQRIQPRHQP